MGGLLDQPLLELCDEAIRQAKAAGAGQAEAFAETSRSVSARAEQNDLVGAQADESLSLGLRVLVKGAVGFCSLNRGDEESLQHAARTAVALARAGTPDPSGALVGPTPIPSIDGLWDGAVTSVAPSLAVERCHALLCAARAVDKRISIDGCEVDFSAARQAVCNSEGVRAETRGTSASQSIFGMAIDGEDVSSFDHEIDAATSLAGLPGVLAGPRLAERLLRCLGARAWDGPEAVRVVLSPDALLEVLLGPLLDSLNGENVRLGRSRLAGKLGQPVASPSLTLLDDPLEAGHIGSEPFDREGTGHRRMALVEQGVLRTFLHNGTSARRAGTVSTGHATGSARGVPAIGVTRAVMDGGDASLDALVAEAKDGLYVGRFSGNVDEVSGDFSGVAKCSFRIRDGKLQEPLKETLISGNAIAVLERIVGVSRERKEMPVELLPWVLVDGMDVAGGE